MTDDGRLVTSESAELADHVDVDSGENLTGRVMTISGEDDIIETRLLEPRPLGMRRLEPRPTGPGHLLQHLPPAEPIVANIGNKQTRPSVKYVTVLPSTTAVENYSVVGGGGAAGSLLKLASGWGGATDSSASLLEQVTNNGICQTNTF